MNTKKKILLFSPPFSGHINVLKDLILKFGSEFQFKLIVTGWDNIEPDIANLKAEVTLLSQAELRETDPALWTLPRVVDLLGKSLEITKDFEPDIIIYDFFSLEGYFAGKLLNIPVWCSIPAMIGPFGNKDYLDRKLSEGINQKSIAQLMERFGIELENLEIISDGLHISGDINIIWSYPSLTISNFLENRHSSSYIFVGNLKNNNYVNKTKSHRPTIYFSLGTVVMNNLWSQQEETKNRLSDFIKNVVNLWKDKPWDIVFVSRGKQFLDKFPGNWRVIEKADQIKELSRADLFITHGGSNSFHEAVAQGVPMVVIPFFGDQPLIGKRVEELGMGINLGKDRDIDTKRSKDFLNEQLIQELDSAVTKILTDDKYKEAYKNISLESYSPKSLLEGKIEFKEGDLLYGTNVARHRYITETKSHEDFRISEFRPFFELAKETSSLPRIIDIYHDVILDKNFYAKDIESDLEAYKDHLKEYKEYLGDETDLCAMCIKGLDFFTKFYKIHFILEDYDPRKNYITTKEIQYILDNHDRLRGSVTFYKKTGGTWAPVDYSAVAYLVNIQSLSEDKS